MTYRQTTPESLFDDAPPAKGTPDYEAGVARLERAIDQRDGKIHTDPPNRAESPRERHRRKLRSKRAQRKVGR